MFRADEFQGYHHYLTITLYVNISGIPIPACTLSHITIQITLSTPITAPNTLFSSADTRAPLSFPANPSKSPFPFHPRQDPEADNTIRHRTVASLGLTPTAEPKPWYQSEGGIIIRILLAAIVIVSAVQNCSSIRKSARFVPVICLSGGMLTV
jgi:hypothetical protein